MKKVVKWIVIIFRRLLLNGDDKTADKLETIVVSIAQVQTTVTEIKENHGKKLETLFAMANDTNKTATQMQVLLSGVAATQLQHEGRLTRTEDRLNGGH